MLITKIYGDLAELSIGLTDVLTITVDRTTLATKRTALSARLGEIGEQLAMEVNGSLPRLRLQSAKRLEALQDMLDGPARAHKAYVTALSEWQEERGKLVENGASPGTIRHIESLIEAIVQLPAERQSCQDERMAKAKEIFAEIDRLSETYRDVYRPVQQFSNNHPIISNRFGLSFSVTIHPSMELTQDFFSIVHHGAIGSFCGKEEGELAFKALIDRRDFSSVEDALAFADDVIAHLTHDRRDPKAQAVSIDKQLRKGKTLENLYDFIYSFGYLEPHYNLNLGQKELSQLSPGERGMLLLVFYLLIDKDDIPLIIDQPEGNLDNQTVFQILGERVKEARNTRQIIIVTHNPNLAVACDADQIICASLDSTDGNRVDYIAGAIEDLEINQLLIDILEGTWPAFNNREAKYINQAANGVTSA